MATIILVHGRSQQFQDPVQLESRFERALIDGLAAAGISRRPRPEEILFPFYGHLYEGFALALTQPTSVREKQEELAFERAFAMEVQAKFARQGRPIPPPVADDAEAFFDPLLGLLDRVPGFGSGAVRLFLRDVHAYQTNKNGLRDKTMAIVKEPIVNSQDDDIILIAHSMGSIVTYDVLNSTPSLKVALYVTIGAPLGIDNAVKERLLRDASGRLGVPAGVRNWVNVADPDDVVALDESLADDFPGSGSVVIRDISVRNPTGDPHGSDGYLRQTAVGRAIGSVLEATVLGTPALVRSAIEVESLARRPAIPPPDELPPASTTLLTTAETIARSGRTSVALALGESTPFALAAGAVSPKVRSAQIASDFQATGAAEVIVVPHAAMAPARLAGAIRVASAEDASLGAAAAAAPSIMAAAAELSQFFVPPVQESAMRAGMREEAALARTRVTGESGTAPLLRVYPHLGVMLGTVTPEGLAGLAAHGAVRQVLGTPPLSLIRPPRWEPGENGELEEEREERSALSEEDASAAVRVTWGLRRLGIPALRSKGLTGAGVLVGHLDTGVDGAHPALSDAIKHFASFDRFGDLDSAATDPFDTGWHGTHTAGTIAGRRANGHDFGVAPGAHLASAAVIEGGRVVARILGGLDWCVGKGVRIVNLSLGLRTYTEDFLDLIRLLRARNILPVIAVGNEGAGNSRSPGNYAEALSVGAIEENDTMWPDSSSFRFQREIDPIVPDLVAPGASILSAMPNGEVGLSWGTSMATPHVAGLAALLWEAKPDATPTEIERAILNSCARPAAVSAVRGGVGVPDAVKALELLVGIEASGGTWGTGAVTAKTERVAPRRRERHRTA